MSPISYSALLLSLLAATSVQAQTDAALGCGEVGCPTANGTAGNDCKVAGKTLINVGVAGVQAADGLPQGLSWVQGLSQSRSNGKGYQILETSYYLGAPPRANISMPACAVLFHDFNFRFPSTLDVSEPSCGNVVEKQCIDALVKRATAITAGGNEDPCKKLQEDLEKNLDEACKKYGQDGSWANVTAKALSGSVAPKPISETQNSTSNCWPVVDKSNYLTLIESHSANTTYMAEDIQKAIGFVTPILTVFYPEGKDAQAQLTCSMLVDSSVKGNANKQDSGAGALSINSLWALGAIAVGVLFAL